MPTESKGPVGIYDRHLNKTRGAEINLAAYALLFSQIVQYAAKDARGIQAVETKLSDLGYKLGPRLTELVSWRERTAKRETRVLGMLSWIHTTLWKALWGKTLDALEKSTENEDEYMLTDNDPIVSRYVSVPREMAQFNAASFVAGIIESVLDGSGFKARVTAHSTGDQGSSDFPNRTTYLIKFDKTVLEREKSKF